MNNNIIFWSGIWNWRFPEYIRPMAPYELSHWLRLNGYRCQVVEFVQHMTAEEIVELTELAIGDKTFAIAMSTTFWPLDGPKGSTIGIAGTIPANIAEAASIIKDRYPNLEFIGGGHRTVRYEKFFDRIFDAIETDGENQILKYCNEKKYKVSFPTKQFNIVELEHRYIEQDIILPHEALPIELGRGCIFKCKFCSYLNIGKKKHTYQRKYDNVLEEFAYTTDMFGTKNFMILDDTVNEDKEKMSFLSTIPKKINSDFTWSGFLRADLIWAHKNHDSLFESGLRNVFFGIETLHPKTAKVIGKSWMGTHAKEWIPHLYNDLWKKQVAIEASFIVGLPYETEQDMLKTVEWANDADIGSVMFFPFNLRNDFEEGAPVSEFTRDYDKYNYIINDNNEWVNTETGLTRHSTIDLSYKLNNMVIDKWRVSGWRSNTYYNMGLEIDDIRKIYVKQGHRTLLNYKNRFVQRYIREYKNFYSRL